MMKKFWFCDFSNTRKDNTKCVAVLKHTVHEKSISKKITPQDINNVFEEENSMSGIDSSKINYFGELINLLEQKK